MGDVGKVRQVVELIRAREAIESFIYSSSKQIEKDLGVEGYNSDHAKRIVKAIDSVFQKHIATMIEIVVGGMVSAYSDEEMDALIGFYSTPIGKSIMSKQNEINASNMREISTYNAIIIYPDLQKSVFQVLDEIEAELKIEAEQKEKE